MYLCPSSDTAFIWWLDVLARLLSMWIVHVLCVLSSWCMHSMGATQMCFNIFRIRQLLFWCYHWLFWRGFRQVEHFLLLFFSGSKTSAFLFLDLLLIIYLSLRESVKTYSLDACRINQVLVTAVAKHFYNCKMLDMLVLNAKWVKFF